MKKRFFAGLLAVAIAVSFTACGSKTGTADADKSTSTDADATHIYVLTAAEDHGWTGSVATFAKEKVEEVNKEGTYTAEVITSADATEQITKIEDIVASDEENIAVVIQPMDDTVQSAIQQLVDAKIPYVAFDRIIDAVSDSAVSNVKGDNEGIGAGAAAYFVSLGLQPGEDVYVYEGDTSSVTTLRDKGFTEYLTGEIDFAGRTISDDLKWSEDDLDAITYSGAMNWSRSDTKESYGINSLSGGNQQKLFLARWLNTEADILLLDNPTQGIDVGAKAEIYKLILELASKGKSILINTLEIPELQKVADYCIIFYEGSIIKILPHEEINEQTVMMYSVNAVNK